jgi:MFS family permease
VIGFAAGGTLVGFLGVRPSLVADAVTFAASALIVRAWTRHRPAVRASAGATAAPPGVIAGARSVFVSPALRTPMFFGWLSAFYNAPEGIAAPLARALGGGSIAVGLVLAAEACGSMLGAILFSRFVDPARRLRWMGLLAVGASGVLVLFATRPRLPAALLILALSGVFACFQLAANAAFVSAAPEAGRSQAFGIAQGGMSFGQGVAMILAGAAAERFAPAAVIATSGAAGAVTAGVIAISSARRRRVPAGRFL